MGTSCLSDTTKSFYSRFFLPTPTCILSQAQKKGYEGPVLGPKEADANPREFTEEQLKEGQGHIGLQMGTNKVRKGGPNSG